MSRAFSVWWSAALQIAWKKNKVLTCEKSSWPPIHCFVHKYGGRDVNRRRSIVSTVREKGWRIGESW